MSEIVDPADDIAAIDAIIATAPRDYPGLTGLARYRAELVARLPRGGVESADAQHACRRYSLALPYEAPPKPLTGNYRSRNYRAKSAATRQLRSDVMQVAKAAGLHRIAGIQHVTVELVWAPGDRRQRDEDNLWPFLKVAADGLARGRRDWVGLELVPTDTPTHMTKMAPRIDPPPAPKGVWLHVTPHLEWPHVKEAA